MKKKYALLILLIVCLSVPLFLIEKDKSFIVIEDKLGNPMAIIPAQKQFSTVYIHSSEKQPWENIYTINDDNTFTLMTMKVRSLGPGVPYNIEEGWRFYIKDGYFVYDNIRQNFQSVDIKLSSISPHFIKENDKTYNLALRFEQDPVSHCTDHHKCHQHNKLGIFHLISQ